jgi:hypothetical protein
MNLIIGCWIPNRPSGNRILISHINYRKKNNGQIISRGAIMYANVASVIEWQSSRNDADIAIKPVVTEYMIVFVADQ